jgi:small-conductance mechanosensitive channel
MLSTLRHRHEPLTRFTNFIGILFQTICHALGYTVTRSGIAHFQVSVNYGKVSPKKEKTGVFEWISTSFLLLGPFFIPAGILLLCSYFVMSTGFVIPKPVTYTFAESLAQFETALFTFAEGFLRFLGSIDLFNPVHIGFLLLLFFFGMGIRPSYMGEERKEKINMISDLKNIKNHLIQKPLYLLILLLFIYLFFYLSLFLGRRWYLAGFIIFGWIALIAIISILLTFLLLLLIKATDSIARRWNMLPFLTVPFSYTLARLFFLYFPIDQIETISLLIMLFSTLIVTILLIKYKKTNRFKTASKMKHMKVEDGKKRTPEK